MSIVSFFLSLLLRETLLLPYFSCANLPFVFTVRRSSPLPRISTIIATLLPSQCRQCSVRAPSSTKGRARLDTHMDWHYRHNKRARDSEGRGNSRAWFVDAKVGCVSFLLLSLFRARRRVLSSPLADLHFFFSFTLSLALTGLDQRPLHLPRLLPPFLQHPQPFLFQRSCLVGGRRSIRSHSSSSSSSDEEVHRSAGGYESVVSDL